MKSIHVKLPYEGRVVVVFEELGDQRLGEFVFINDYERVTALGPAYQIGIAGLVEKAGLVSM